MRCSTCNEHIQRGQQTAHGPDGFSHAECAKRGKAQGQVIDMLVLLEEIGRLKARVQELELEVTHHSRSIDFRVGGHS